eukprot:Nitzschia sp. Nitz4//scaffold4_size323378//280638//282290//NITZ4_000709-RA/size323378-processed-gene-0.308-mRNA-1//1//CDS//3329553546//6628//frame0
MTTTAVQIPCCLCGTPIFPNAANQCNACLAQQFDLKDLLYRNTGGMLDVYQCRQCRKFARTPQHYEYCEPESPQLLSICLKHIPAFVNSKTKLHIVDAMWVWTEPHSMRLKVRVTLRTEVDQVPLQQRVLVEFQIKWKQCHDCNREFTSRTWQAIVQLRQKRDSAGRKGLATLEMALRRNEKIRKHVLKIDSCRNGLDFYFLSLSQAQAFSGFLAKLAPMKIKTSQKLVSTDNHNNTANIKYTITADMVPLCRDDLILVGKGSRSLLSGRLGLVLKVTSNIQIVDASPKRTAQMDAMDISAESYYKVGGDMTFPIIQTAERMIRWVVLDVEPIETFGTEASPETLQSKYSMANVLVARESDMGQNDSTYSCVTHMGNILSPGDVVMGYDLESTSATLSTTSSLGVVDLDELLHSNVVMPDVVLVRKVAIKLDGDATASDLANPGTGEDEPTREGKKRVSKKKLRRRKKEDKKQRELAESAARMGFLDNEEGRDVENDWDNDADFVAEVEEVERQLENYQPMEPETGDDVDPPVKDIQEDDGAADEKPQED